MPGHADKLRALKGNFGGRTVAEQVRREVPSEALARGLRHADTDVVGGHPATPESDPKPAFIRDAALEQDGPNPIEIGERRLFEPFGHIAIEGNALLGLFAWNRDPDAEVVDARCRKRCTSIRLPRLLLC